MTTQKRRLAAVALVACTFLGGVQQRVRNPKGTLAPSDEVAPAIMHSTRRLPPVDSQRLKARHLIAEAVGAESSSVSRKADVFRAFDEWCEKYESPGAKADEQLEREGEKIAIERRTALAAVIPEDPELALKLAVPYERRKVLPDSILRHLERPVSAMARYDVVAIAPATRAPESSSVMRYVTFDGATYTASVYGRRVTLPSMASTPLHGIAIEGALAVDEHPVRVLGALEAQDRLASAAPSALSCPISSVPGSASYAAEIGGEVRYFCHNGHIDALNKRLEEAEGGSTSKRPLASFNTGPTTQGDKSLLLIRINFVDDLTERLSFPDAERLIGKVNSFFTKNSYGKLSIRGTVTPLLTLPLPKASYRTSDEEGNFVNILTAARAAALAAGFDSSAYDLDCVHLDGSVISARGFVGGKGATLDDNDPGRACHELGHNLGLWHANAWRTRDGSITGNGANAEYGNVFDTMGSGSRDSQPYNAFYRYSLGWLPQSAVQTITSDGVYTLFPFDISALDSGRAYALRLRKDDSRDYWIETREDANGDLLMNWTPWYRSSGGTQLLDMTPGSEGGCYDASLKIGRSFYDPELGIKIVPLKRDSSSGGAVSVLVKHVQYLDLAADTANLSGGYTRTEGADATNTDAINLSPQGSAIFNVNVTAAGDYTLWFRTMGPWAPVVITVDEYSSQTADSLETANFDWHWSRVRSAGLPVRFPLSQGFHTLRLSGGADLAKIDSLLLADDPTSDFAPSFQSIPDQIAILGNQTIISGLLVSPETKLDGTELTATSANQNVVADADMSIQQISQSGKIAVVVSPRALGETVISLRAITADRRSGVTTFNLSVRGPVQLLIDTAAAGETVRLRPGTYLDHVLVSKNVTLEGESAAETILDGSKNGPTLVIAAQCSVTLKNLTIRNGLGGIVNSGVVHVVECEITQNLNSPRGGGGVWNGSAGEMLIERSTISSNRCSGLGGGIYNLGNLQIIDSTVSGNRSNAREGGGIYNSNFMQAVHCTVAFNRSRGGGGIANAGTGILEMSNTIVAGNASDVESSSDIKGRVVSRGHNFVQNTAGADIQGDTATTILGQDPLLGPLANNGGSTRTHALVHGSPAIDAGDAGGLDVDQRGLSRVSDVQSISNIGDGADIGAYEFVPENSDLGAIVGTSAHPAIVIKRDADGEVIVSLKGASDMQWVLQATSDFVSWDTLGLLPKGETAGLKDTAAREVSSRFYRALRY